MSLGSGTWVRWAAPLAVSVAALLGSGRAAAQDACSGGGLCRAPDGADAWVSNPNATFAPLQADSFTLGEDAAVSAVCFWGISWSGSRDCVGADLFSVTYFDDGPAGTCPGSVRAGPFAVTGTRTPTGSTLQGAATEYRWSLQHPAVSLAAGVTYWLGIANADETCFFWWETSDDADGTHCERQAGGDSTRAGDLAFCLNAGPGDCPARVVASEPSVPAVVSARLLATAYGARDRGLLRSPAGRRLVRLYYEHAPTMARILRERPVLRRRATLLLAAVAPGLADDARGRSARIPPHAVALLHGVLDGFAEADAHGALGRAIARERHALLSIAVPGLAYASAWERLER